MLNLDAISNAKMFELPFRWGIIDGLIPLDGKALQMGDDFPVDSFRFRRHLNGSYMRRRLIALDEQAPHRGEELADSYHELVADLLHPAYRGELGRVTGLDLMRAPMEAALWRADSNTIYAPHDDVATKILTHVIYLNSHWKKRDGGVLQILSSRSEEDVQFEIVPQLGLSVLIARSDDSWHNITPVSRSAPDTRNTLTVHFYQPGTREEDLPVR